MFVGRTSRRLIATGITEKDYPLLCMWRNEEDFIAFCSNRRGRILPERFIAELKRDFDFDKHEQFMLRRHSDDCAVGTMFSYGLHLTDGNVFVTVYIAPEHQRNGYGPEAMALFFRYLFKTFPLRKIYVEIFAYNELSMSTLLSAGCIHEEGRFKGHRHYNGQYHDLVRFAVYPSVLENPVFNRLLLESTPRAREVADTT